MKRALCLLMALLLLPAAALGAGLRQGDTGDEVQQLQSRLCELGLLSGKPDGIFGAQSGSQLAVRLAAHTVEYGAGQRFFDILSHELLFGMIRRSANVVDDKIVFIIAAHLTGMRR